MFSLSQITAISLALGSVVAQFPNQKINEELKASLSNGTEFYFPDDSDWTTDLTQRWTIYEPTVPVYVAAIKPALPEDVAGIIKIANKYNISYLATGGGHGLSITLGGLNDGIDIDLSNFRDINIDTEGSTVTVGGGSTFGTVIPEVYKAGFEIVTGSCPCVGAVGATVGGGLSRLQGLYGMIVDNVVSFKTVTADGSIINVSDDDHPDLFWAMRGAGHNFGIVVEVTYKIHPVRNNGKALNADMIFPPSSNQTHWKLLQEYIGKVPAELSLVTGIQWSDDYGFSFFLNAVYYGPEEEGRKIIAPFLANNPLVSNVTVIDAADVVNAALFGATSEDGPTCEKGQHLNPYTVGLKDMDIPTFEKLFSDMGVFFDKYPQARHSLAQFEFLANQAVKAVPAGSNAYPESHRQINTQGLWLYNYDDPSIEKDITEFAKMNRDNFAKTSGFDEIQLYTSYAHGDEGAEVWYRESLPRLREVKKVYDPENKFRFFDPVVA